MRLFAGTVCKNHPNNPFHSLRTVELEVESPTQPWYLGRWQSRSFINKCKCYFCLTVVYNSTWHVVKYDMPPHSSQSLQSSGCSPQTRPPPSAPFRPHKHITDRPRGRNYRSKNITVSLWCVSKYSCTPTNTGLIAAAVVQTQWGSDGVSFSFVNVELQIRTRSWNILGYFYFVVTELIGDVSKPKLSRSSGRRHL